MLQAKLTLFPESTKNKYQQFPNVPDSVAIYAEERLSMLNKSGQWATKEQATLVSTSKNGNWCPPVSMDMKYMSMERVII